MALDINALPTPTDEEKNQYINSIDDLPTPDQEAGAALPTPPSTPESLPVPTQEEAKQYDHASVDPVYSQVLATINRPIKESITKSPLFVPETMTDKELQSIARAHNIDYKELREVAPYFNALLRDNTNEEIVKGALKNTAGFLGSVAFDIPQFIAKKFYDDENFRKALDDTRRLAQAKKSWLQVAAEGAVPLGTTARVAEAGVARGIAEAGAIGAAAGAAQSQEGREVEGAALGATLGAGAGAAIQGATAALRRITPKVEANSPLILREASEVADKEPKIDLTRGTEQVLKETEAPRKVEQDIILSDSPMDSLDREDVVKVLDRLDAEDKRRLLDTETDVGSSIQLSAHEANEAAERKLAQTMVKDRLIDFSNRVAPEIGADSTASFKNALDNLVKFKKQFGNEYAANRYKAFEAEQAALEYIKKSSAESGVDSFSGLWKLADKVSDMKYVLRIADEKYGSALELAHNDLNSNYNKYTFVKDHLLNKSKELQDKIEKADLDPAEAYNIIDQGLEYTTLPQAQQDAINAYKQQFEQLRQLAMTGDKSSGVAGIPIEARKNYVPYRLKSVPEYVVAVDNKLDELNQKFGTNILNLDNSEFRKLVADPDVQEFINGITYLDNREIKNIDQFRNAVRAAQTPAVVKDSMNLRAKSSFARDDESMPSWIREHDIRKLLDDWASNTLRYMYLREPVEKLKSTARVLDRLGAEREASYINKAATDMISVREGTLSRAYSNLGNSFRTAALRAANKAPEGSTAKAFYETMSNGPELLNEMSRMIYPNALGYNVKAVLRNLTQPMLMNVPELGYGYGSYLTPRAYVDAAVNYDGLVRQLKELGLTPAEFTGETPEYLMKGIQSSALYKIPAKSLEKLGKVGMYLYSKSDEVNRVITLSMSNKLTDDLIRGSQLANQALQRFPRQIRRSVEQALSAGHEDTARAIIAKHLNAATQFNYNRLSLSEFGREMGPLFSMFTKWPSSIAGDIYATYKTKGAGEASAKVAYKHLMPLVGLGMMQRAVFGDAEEMSDREKSLIGSRGLIDMAPVISIESIASGKIMQPPVVSALTNSLLKTANTQDKDPKQLSKDVLSGLIYSFVPGMGLVRFITDDLNTFINGHRPRGNFIERTEEGAKGLTR